MNRDERTKRTVIGHGLGYAVLALFAASWLSAQEAAQPAAPTVPEFAPGPLPVREMVATIGPYRVGAQGPWTPTERKAQRGAGLWKRYMHGVVDFFAVPVPWESMLDEKQSPAHWLDRSVQLKTPVRISEMPSLKLSTGDVVVLGKPLPYPRTVKAMDTLRVFVWLTAKEANGHAEAEVLPSRTPSFEVVATMPDGSTSGVYPGPVRTRGTFDWHCYYVDVPIAGSRANGSKTSDDLPDADGAALPRLYLRLRNPTSGTVWFSTLSCEVVGASNSYSPEERQDPVTGSLAPFAAMDELAVHLMSGRAYAHPWRFFEGPAGGAENVPNLKDAKAAREYLLAAGKSDETGCLGGCVFLGPWLYAGEQHPDLLNLGSEWRAAFMQALLSLQESRTGFWGTPQSPANMAATTAVVEYFWGGPAMVRGADTIAAKPWLNYGGKALPNAKSIVETVLESRTRRKAGGVDVGAWGQLSYEWRVKGEVESDICSLAATRNAFVLLRLASVHLGNADKERVYAALEGAWQSVFRLCVLNNGLWRLSARDADVGRPVFLPTILDLAPCLEERTDETLMVPTVAAAMNDRAEAEFSWREPAPGTQSVRVFAAPKETAPADVHMGHLVGIIEQDGSSIWSMDPIHMVGQIQAAALARWGIDIASAPDVPFLASRLDVYGKLLGKSASGKPLSIPPPRNRVFYVAAVRAAGEQSKLVPVEVAGLSIEDEPAKEPPAQKPADQDPLGLGEEKPADQDPLGLGEEKPVEAPAPVPEGM